MGRPRSWNEENLKKALYEYHNNYDITVENICKKYNIPKASFMANLDYKEEWRLLHKKRLYSFNLNKFKEDSKEKYYWLGFISADGAIVDTTLTIELKNEDRDHLINFNNFFENTSPLKERINNNKCSCVKATINSKELIEYLKNYNIVQNKSLIFEIPTDKIPKEYLYDFIRGLIDGDGTVCIRSNGQITLGFCSGSKKCIEQVKEILQIDNSISLSEKTYHFSVAGNIKAIKILDKVYNNSSEKNRLKRKYDNYIKIKSEDANLIRHSHQPIKVKTINTITNEVVGIYNSLTEAGKALGISRDTVSKGIKNPNYIHPRLKYRWEIVE